MLSGIFLPTINKTQSPTFTLIRNNNNNSSSINYIHSYTHSTKHIVRTQHTKKQTNTNTQHNQITPTLTVLILPKVQSNKLNNNYITSNPYYPRPKVSQFGYCQLNVRFLSNIIIINPNTIMYSMITYAQHTHLNTNTCLAASLPTLTCCCDRGQTMLVLHYSCPQQNSLYSGANPKQ